MKAPILIVGMGKSGKSALRLLLLLGYSHDQIKTFDGKPGVADFHKPEELFTLKPQTLLVSPGVDLKTPWIQNLVQSGCKLTSEIDLAVQHLKTEKVIAITGSMGKSTTTSLLAVGAQSFSPNSFAGGNLGFPLADYVADVLENKRPRADWVILELSSYQLENCPHLKSNLSILTALSPNHLERYATLEDYYSAKWTLKDKTEGPFLLNFDNSEISRWCAPKLDNQCLQVRVKNSEFKNFHLNNAKLVGDHNQQNLALAAQTALSLQWPQSSIEAMKNYAGLSHRIENAGTHQGVQFINDSKATTMESVLAAVEACLPLVKNNGVLHVLLGGRDKNLPWEDLSKLSQYKRIQYYFFGEFSEGAQKKSKLSGNLYLKLQSAIEDTIKKAKAGDVVLLSPGGSSLDEFKNFEERGDFFKKLISTSGLH